MAFFSLMLIAYIIIETEPRIGQFLQAALLLPAGKRPKKAKKPDCVPIWWLSGHITAKKSQIWLDISQISSTFEQLQLARAAAAALCAPSKRQIWPYMAHFPLTPLLATGVNRRSLGVSDVFPNPQEV